MQRLGIVYDHGQLIIECFLLHGPTNTNHLWLVVNYYVIFFSFNCRFDYIRYLCKFSASILR